MLASDNEIRAMQHGGDITIYPFSSEYVQPASYDVHLGQGILMPKRRLSSMSDMSVTHVDPGDLPQAYMIERILPPRFSRERFWIAPGEALLGHTDEQLTLNPKSPVAADIAGISSLGRLFLFVHCTAGFVDPGWSGQLTLEIFNASPWFIRLWYGMRIGQLRFYDLTSQPNVTYDLESHYFGSNGVVASRYNEPTTNARTDEDV